jgi:hypothetical protein
MQDGCRQKPGILEIPGFYVLRFFMLTYLEILFPHTLHPTPHTPIHD